MGGQDVEGVLAGVGGHGVDVEVGLDGAGARQAVEGAQIDMRDLAPRTDTGVQVDQVGVPEGGRVVGDKDVVVVDPRNIRGAEGGNVAGWDVGGRGEDNAHNQVEAINIIIHASQCGILT